MEGNKLSRRDFVALGVGAAAATFVGVEPALAAPPPLTRKWFDITRAALDKNLDDQKGSGYLPLWISICDGSPEPVYSAGFYESTSPHPPGWTAQTNMSLADLLTYQLACFSTGYRITHLSSIGTRANPTFAAIAQALGSGTLATDLDLVALQGQLALARLTLQIPTAVASYGTPADPRFAVAFEPNTLNVAWSLDGVNETVAQLDQRKAAQLLSGGSSALLGAHLALCPISPTVNYTSLFRADVLDTSKSVVAKYGLTRAELDSEMNRLVNPNEAYLPIFVSAGGVTTPTAENRRYSAVWSRHLSAAGRSMSKTGDSRALGVDAVIENIMAINGVRHATLAIVRDKKLLYARAFTRAEQTYALAWPTTHFRLASCSKMLTAMLVMNLIEKKDIPPLLDGSGKVLTAAIDRRLSDFLPLTTLNGSPPTDARFTSITIRQLLEHHSGLAKTYSPWSVVRPGVFMPPSQAQWCSYAAEQTLEFTPGTGKVLFSLDPIIWQREYSNVGYMLLGRMCRSIVRKLPGRGAFSFLDVLKERILTPLGITRCRVFTALDGNQAAEARYDSAVLNVGPSVVTTQPTMYPMPYGADMDPNAWEASGGLTMAAPDYAKVLACFSVGADPMVVDKVLTEASRDFMLSNRVGFDGGDAMFSAWKGGMLMGAQTQLHVVKGGISFIVCFSRDFDSSPINANFPDLRAAVDAESWPINHDLFPTPGIDIPAL